MDPAQIPTQYAHAHSCTQPNSFTYVVFLIVFLSVFSFFVFILFLYRLFHRNYFTNLLYYFVYISTITGRKQIIAITFRSQQNVLPFIRFNPAKKTFSGRCYDVQQ